MIRNILFSILLAHSALVAQGKPSRIILQAPPAVNNNPDPVGTVNAIPPPQFPQAPEPPILEQTIITNPSGITGTTSSPQAGTTSSGTTSAPATIAQTTQAVSPGTTSAPASVTSAPAPGTTAASSSGTTSAPVGGTTAAASNPVTTSSGSTGTTLAAIQTPAPTTSAPTTPFPTTSAPTTSSPTTGAPTTASPTLPPLPLGYEYGTWGQACPEVGNQQECVLLNEQIFSEGVNNRGIINCDRRADCCKCGSIQCGNAIGIDSHGCHHFMAGDYGVYGVKAVSVIGNIAEGGAEILCSGFYGCAEMNLFGDSVNNLMCNVDNSCQGAIMQINNPADNFWIDCNGPESCKNLKVVLNIGTAPPEGQQCNPMYHNDRRFGGIKCNAPHACDGLDITINNLGCDHIILGELDCLQRGSCNNANFVFNGDIEIENCQCGPSCGFASGLGKCFQNLERLICADIRSCMNMIKTILNPKDLFYLECSNELSCAMADFTIDLEQDLTNPGFANSQPTRYIEKLHFGGPSAGRGAIVRIHNHQLIDPSLPGSAVQVTIGILECSSTNSCQGLTIFTGDNVSINNVVCGTSSSCLGCMIKRDEFDAGRPCDPRAILFNQLPQGPPQFIPQQPGNPQFVPQGPPQFVPAI